MRLFPPRQLLLRTATGYLPLTISGTSQLLFLTLLGLLTGGITFGAIGYLAGHARLAEQEREITALRDQVAAVSRSRSGGEARLRGMVADLDHLGEQQRATIDSLSDLETSLRQELASAQEDLAAVSRERDSARQAVRDPGPVAAGAEADQPVATADAAQAATLQAQLADLVSERDRLGRSESGLRWRVGMLETRLADMRQNAGAEAAHLRRWIVAQVNTLEGVLATSGVDVDRLLQRVDPKLSSGQGGPFEPVPDSMAGRNAAGVVWQPEMKAEMSRLTAVHVLLEHMPLVAPLGTYKTTSEFGVRRDPVTGREAMHTGLDFGGPSGAQVLATAPGRVIQAGWAGAYGNMVEIDHGMGITTRYGHLRSVLVKVGETVTLHERVGIMGSTGRSTGEHCHYEVRLDGVAYDPAAFLDAGKNLKDVLKG